jgi:hypothetical protein
MSAIVEYGFTERQVRFLILVMRHAGLRIKRQRRVHRPGPSTPFRGRSHPGFRVGALSAEIELALIRACTSAGTIDRLSASTASPSALRC